MACVTSPGVSPAEVLVVNHVSLARYEIALVEVERTAQPASEYGTPSISEVFEDGQKRYVFEDALFRATWYAAPKDFSFLLANKSDHSIRVIWDRGVFVDDSGASHRMMHSGVRYLQRDSPQPPSVIVRDGLLNDGVLPTDCVFWKPGHYGGWEQKEIFGPTRTETPSSHLEFVEVFEADARANIGRRYKVLLPIEDGGSTHEYVFVFEVKGVEFQHSPPLPE